MGSLTSRPKAPAYYYYPQPVMTVAPTPVSVPAPSSSTTQPPSAATDSAVPAESNGSEQAQAEGSVQNLLNRSRSRFSTVLTSFRGILSTGAGDGQPKSLLGE